MTNYGRHPTTKHIGHKPGQPRQQVDPSAYPAMSQMEQDGWGWSIIGKKFGITGPTAKAEAEALRVQREAITSELLELRQIEVQRQAVDKWDGKLPAYVGGESVPLIGIGKAA